MYYLQRKLEKINMWKNVALGEYQDLKQAERHKKILEQFNNNQYRIIKRTNRSVKMWGKKNVITFHQFIMKGKVYNIALQYDNKGVLKNRELIKE